MNLHNSREEVEVHGRAQVVAVRHEHVLDALLQKPVKGAAAFERRVQVAVTGRAPLVVDVGRVFAWQAGGGVDFGHLFKKAKTYNKM